jgi:hypothetical protein
MAPTDRFEMKVGNERTAGRVRSGISLIGRLYAAAPPDISGAEVSWRTVPWFLPLWVGSALPLLALGNGVASDVIIVLVCVGCGWGWWKRVGRHWHPIKRIREWRV